MVSSPSRLAVISSLLSIFMLVPPGRAADAPVIKIEPLSLPDLPVGRHEVVSVADAVTGLEACTIYLEGCNPSYVSVNVLGSKDIKREEVEAIYAHDCNLTHLFPVVLISFPNLKVVRANRCGLISASLGPNQMLSFAKDLGVFDVAENEIENIPWDYFLLNAKLKQLDLSSNKLKNLSKMEVSAALDYFSCADNSDLEELPTDFAFLGAHTFNVARCPKLREQPLEFVSDKLDHKKRWGMVEGTFRDRAALPHKMSPFTPVVSEPRRGFGKLLVPFDFVYSVGATAATAATKWVTGEELPSARVLWAKDTPVLDASKRVNIGTAQRHLQYALSQKDTWDTPGVAWKAGFLEALRLKVNAVRGKNPQFFYRYIADVAGGDKATIDGVRDFFVWAYNDRDSKAQTLTPAQIRKYAANCHALAALFASTDKKVKAIAAYCLFVGKKCGVKGILGAPGLKEVFEAFCEARLMTLEAEDVAALDTLFPPREVDRLPAKDVELLAAIPAAAYDAWDQFYVAHSALTSIWAALFQRVLDMPTEQWARTPDFITTEKAVRIGGWPEEWDSVHMAVGGIADVLSILAEHIQKSGDVSGIAKVGEKSLFGRPNKDTAGFVDHAKICMNFAQALGF